MNKLKPLFISVFLTFAFVFALLEAIQLTEGNELLIGISLAIPVTILLLFAKFFLFKAPRTSPNLPVLSALLFLLYLGAVAVMLVSNYFPIDLITYNTGAVLGWIIYLKWYSVFPERASDTLQVGKLLPLMSFKSTDHEIVTSEEFEGKKVIYLFYRGNWCPLCMAQIREIADQYQELSRRGVELVLVSPQPPRHTKSLAKKFDVSFNFLRDEQNLVATQLGINHDSGTPFGLEVLGYESDSVMPTVIIADEGGKIIFVDLTDNYRVRPVPKTFLEVLDNYSNSSQC